MKKAGILFPYKLWPLGLNLYAACVLSQQDRHTIWGDTMSLYTVKPEWSVLAHFVKNISKQSTWCWNISQSAIFIVLGTIVPKNLNIKKSLTVIKGFIRILLEDTIEFDYFWPDSVQFCSALIISCLLFLQFGYLSSICLAFVNFVDVDEFVKWKKGFIL